MDLETIAGTGKYGSYPKRGHFNEVSLSFRQLDQSVMILVRDLKRSEQ